MVTGPLTIFRSARFPSESESFAREEMRCVRLALEKRDVVVLPPLHMMRAPSADHAREPAADDATASVVFEQIEACDFFIFFGARSSSPSPSPSPSSLSSSLLSSLSSPPPEANLVEHGAAVGDAKVVDAQVS